VKRPWGIEELVENFMLRPEELVLQSRSSSASQLGLAVLMKFFQHEGRFPTKPSEVPEQVVAFLARQIGFTPVDFKNYRWDPLIACRDLNINATFVVSVRYTAQQAVYNGFSIYKT